MNTLNYPLVCFDLDGTLVDDTVFIWQTLHDTLNTDPVARKSAQDAHTAGRLTYKQWFEHDLRLFRNAGAGREQIREVIHTLKPMSGAREVLEELKTRGHILGIVSGSLDIVVEELFGKNQFDHLLINHIHFDESGQISGGIATPFDLAGKADGLRELARRENLPMNATAFVGDNFNDFWIAKIAGLAIAFNCKSDELRTVCQVEIKGTDLLELLDIVD